MCEPIWRGFLDRTGAMDGYLDGPAFPAAMERVLDGLRASVCHGATQSW